MARNSAPGVWLGLVAALALLPARADAADTVYVDSAGRPIEVTSLAEAVKRALVRNPTAEIAAAEIRRYQAVSVEVRAGWLPTLVGNLSYTRLDANRVLNGEVLAARDQFAGNLTLTAPLFAPKPYTQWRHSKDDVVTALWNAAETRRQLAVSVGRAWLQLVAQHRVIEVAERAELNARSHFDFAHKQYAAGYGTRIDEVRAQQEAETDRTQVESARVQLARLREALGVLMGTNHPVDASDAVELPAPPTVEGQAENEALANRTDVRLWQQKVIATKHVVHDKWADYAPSVVALFEPFFQLPPEPSVPRTGWQAVVALSLPLYDGGLRYGQERERIELEFEAEAQLDGTLRQASSDVRAALEEMDRAAAALAAAREASRLAADALTLTTLAYKGGASTNIEVIDAGRTSRDADTSVAMAEDTSRQALLDLLIASGRFPEQQRAH